MDPKLHQISFAIKTADCLPVLFFGDKLAFVHAGWRGVHNGILLDKKIQSLNISEIYIAPFIKRFEVQGDFKEFFPNSLYFYNVEDKLYFDLEGEAKSQLQSVYTNAKINISPICTLDNPAYNSFRRNKTSKRNWNTFKIT